MVVEIIVERLYKRETVNICLKQYFLTMAGPLNTWTFLGNVTECMWPEQDEAKQLTSIGGVDACGVPYLAEALLTLNVSLVKRSDFNLLRA